MNGQCGLPLSFYAGESFFPPIWTWLDINGNPVNLTGASAVFTARQNVQSPDPAIILATSGAGLILLGGVAGTIQINFNSAFTSVLPFPWNGYWDVFITLQSGAVYRLVGGTLCINEPVGGPARP